MNEKRRFGDRYDGFRLRKIDPIYQLIPVIMRSRLDAQVFYDDFVDVENLEKFVNKMRQNGMPELRTIHLILAALVRVISQKPRINRFIAGKKIFARNEIRLTMAVKKAWNENAETTEILSNFAPEDTLIDVVKKVENDISGIKDSEPKPSATDYLATIISFCPMFLKSFIVFAMRNLDKIGLMPKSVHKASPFHSSVFLTDVGSLGIPAVYHHLYEFGTTSAFLSIGKKAYIAEALPDGSVVSRKKLHLRYVIDERICDGFYFASAIKLLNRCLKNPEMLLESPKLVIKEKR